jgi:adenosylhomocysteine nucleosidase
MLSPTRLAAAILTALGLLIAPGLATAAETLDATPRTAIISAFAPELTALEAAVTDRHDYVVGGTTFTTAMLEGRPVLLFLSGVSMVNAAMTTQAALDRFNIKRIVFSGIAGGVDPDLAVGDVVAPAQWSQEMEMMFARKTAKGYAPLPGETAGLPSHGMMYPRHVVVSREPGVIERRQAFPADPALLAIARGLTSPLKQCVGDKCLAKAPRLVVGGVGVSGPVFVDNAAFRKYVFATWKARVLDMESAAVAQAAYVNKTPFIAFRSLSDLAGGDPGDNQFPVFFQLAAENSATVVKAFVAALQD